MPNIDTTYTRVLTPDDLTDEQVRYWADLMELDIETCRETVFSKLPLIEVGREDYDHSGFRAGGEAVIDPCSWCDGKHTHGFEDRLEQGRPRPRSPHCDIAAADIKDNEATDDYWIVWLGKGKGEWKGDPEILQQPTTVDS